MDKRDVIHAAADVRKQITDIFTALPVLFELPFRTYDATFALMSAAAKRFNRYRLAIQWIKIGLIIKRIDVRRAPVHKEKDNGLRFGIVMRLLNCERIGKVGEPVARQHAAERHGPKAAPNFPEEFAARAPAELSHICSLLRLAAVRRTAGGPRRFYGPSLNVFCDE